MRGTYSFLKPILLLAFCLWGLGLRAQGEGDSLEVSLLTCSPGEEVYSLYGHTALRVRSQGGGEDVVFNYGVFDFRSPHFVWRFILGRCDYMVTAVPYDYFLSGYLERGSYVLEQTLSLSPQEAQRLLAALLDNLRPERRTYRYNYLTENCTTKVRDMLAASLDGQIVLAPEQESKTYRGLMHEWTVDHPWARLGDDLLLGSECDTLLTPWASLFLPFRLAQGLEGARVQDADGSLRPLVLDTRTLSSPSAPRLIESGCVTPLMASWLFLLICLAAGIAEWVMRRQWWWLDALVMTGIGLAGCLLCFMFFFSQHPTVDSNWQIWLFNPLPLLCMPWVVAQALRRRFCLYHWLNIAILAAFLLFFPWIPQHFSEITLPLALGSLLRSLSYTLSYTRR
ncbi:MAG: DUF4105 domain-containing protein [Prevotellaceae bacterium]|nr:DUF4105 domain-containing protein [Prevotellaceae bacterium]